jgi:hypothetical protein
MDFTRQYKDNACAFYTAPSWLGHGFIGFFLYDPAAADKIFFTDCFDLPQYRGYFIFLAIPPDPKVVVSKLKELLPAETLPHTQLVWITAANPLLATAADLVLLKLNEEGIQQNDVQGAWGKYKIDVPAGLKINTEIRENVPGLSWTILEDGIHPTPQPFFLPFAGSDAGLLITKVSIADFSDRPGTGWDVGFRYFMPAAGSQQVVSQYYPLFNPGKNTSVLFKLSWDLVSSNRTTLEFAAFSFIMEPSPGKPGSYELKLPAKPERLRTWLRTDKGQPVYLQPLDKTLMPGQEAKLVLAALPNNDYYWTPQGCFELSLEENTKDTVALYLLCGLSGVETMNFQPRSDKNHGDVLRFQSGMPAYVYNFPGASATGIVLRNEEPASKKINTKNAPHAPGDLYIAYARGRGEISFQKDGLRMNRAGATGTSSYLDDRYMTSWMKVRSFTGASGPINYYYNQPSTSPLYGGKKGSGALRKYMSPGQTEESRYAFLPFFRPPAAVLNDPEKHLDIHFPIVPIAGAMPNKELKKEFLSVFEEQVLLPSRMEQVLKKQPTLKKNLRAGAEDLTSYSTSPQGLLVKIGAGGINWEKLVFAYTPADPKGSVAPELSFSTLGAQLQAAFQKNQMFLVMSVLPASAAKKFQKDISIQGWPFKLNVPETASGSEYRNVLIFKFTKGSIADLVKSPEQWTSAADSNEAPGDVAKWLDTYINKKKDARRSRAADNDQPSLYANFNQLINSDTWTGVLALNLDINLTKFPEQIRGLVGGIDLERFNAHHLGIEVNQVVPNAAGGLEFAEPSSLFGLIDYEGIDQAPKKTEYDFNVDLLQVRFMNNTITDFRCRISLTLSKLFSEEVKFTPVPPKPSTIQLTGTYEKHEGVATYSFLSDAQYTLSSVKGIVWQSIMLSKIQFFTLSQEDNKVNSVFSFWGDMRFNDVGKKQKIDFDLFSFDQLSFNGMQLLMNFEIPERPAARPALNFNFDTSAITFNNSLSVTRDTSLLRNFPLEIKGMVYGDADKLPSGNGYFKIGLPLTIPGDITSAWYALRYDLDLGTPGALAEKAGFTASILACWTPSTAGSETKIAAYLQLPGSSGALQTVLENVLTLSVGNASFSTNKGAGPHPLFQLALNDIAVKVLGYTIPPKGKANASLFTSIDQEGKKDSTGWYIAYNNE